MAYAISDMENDLTALLHGTTLNKVQNKFSLYNRAARTLLNDIDPAETKRIGQLNNALYDQVFDYQSPADLKGDRVIDIRPQVNRTVRDRFFQIYNTEFDLNKYTLSGGNEFTIQWNTATKSIRINKTGLPAGVLLNDCDSLTANGTWAATASAGSLEVDNIYFVQGAGSLKFDLAAAGSTGYIENSTMTAIDLTNFQGVGSIFMYVYVPTVSVITNFILRWGSDSSNYYSNTVTTTQDATAFQVGWNLLRFDWPTATTTGTPVITAMDYLRFTVTYNGTASNDLRVDNIVARLGSIYEIQYYSKYLFRSSAGTFQEASSSTSDIINLDTDSYNVYLNLVALMMAQQVQGANSSFDTSFFQNQYDKSMQRYTNKYKSEIIKPQTQYYRMPKKRTITRRYPTI